MDVNWKSRFEIRYKTSISLGVGSYYLVDLTDPRFVFKFKFYHSEGQARKAAIAYCRAEQRKIERILLG